jgi:hypothetical protein
VGGSMLKRKAVVWGSVLSILLGLTLAVWITLPGGAPWSASRPVAPTELAAVFQKECIDQIDMPWVRRELKRRLWWNCWGDAGGDCAAIDLQGVIWTVPATTGGTVAISVAAPFEDGPMVRGRERCEVYVNERLVGALRDGIPRLRAGGRNFHPVANSAYVSGTDQSDWALSGSSKPRLILYRSSVLGGWGCSSAVYMADYPCGPDTGHPWVLSYYPEEPPEPAPVHVCTRRCGT